MDIALRKGLVCKGPRKEQVNGPWRLLSYSSLGINCFSDGGRSRIKPSLGQPTLSNAFVYLKRRCCVGRSSHLNVSKRTEK